MALLSVEPIILKARVFNRYRCKDEEVMLMSPLSLRQFCVSIFIIAAGAIGVTAQDAKPNSSRPGENVVCLTLDSNYARIADFLPRMRDSLVKSIPKRRKQVQVVAIDSSPQNSIDVARSSGCDYLLQMKVAEVSGAGAGFSTRTVGDGSPEEESGRRELEWVRIDYRLKSLKDDSVDMKDTDHVRYEDNLSGWNASAFETTVFRSVTRIAVGSLSNLPKN